MRSDSSVNVTTLPFTLLLELKRDLYYNIYHNNTKGTLSSTLELLHNQFYAKICQDEKHKSAK